MRLTNISLAQKRLKKVFKPVVTSGMRWAAGMALGVCVAVSHGQTDEDPWEGLNRKVFAFNDKADQWVLRPAAKVYVWLLPTVAEKAVRDFFQNLDQINSGVNSVLQLKWLQAGQCLARFSINATFGLVGFFDVATGLGIPEVDEDFGQTLGFYGIKSGPYMVLPFYGPSTVRETLTIMPDDWLDPVRHISDERTRYAVKGLSLLDFRASLLSVDGLITGDRYTFVRNAYLQRRDYLIKDGQVEDEFLEDDW